MVRSNEILVKTAILMLMVCGASCGEDTSSVAPIPTEYGLPVFDTRLDYPIGCIVHEIVSEDLDGDGDDDIAMPAFFDNRITVMINNGDGTFQPLIGAGSGIFTYSYPNIAAGDLDGDGDTDIVTGNYRSVTVLCNRGDATFDGAVSFGLDRDPEDICLSDIDGDGDLDLAIILAPLGVPGELHVLMNDGSASFEHVSYYPVGLDPVAVCAADLDTDGDMDFIVANRLSFNISILMNGGDGSFHDAVFLGPEVWRVTGFDPGAIVSCDLDGDGDSDMAVGGAPGKNVYVLYNNGDGSFADDFLTCVTDGGYCMLCPVDLEGDGDTDLVTANRWDDCISLFLNDGNGIFTVASDSCLVDYPRSVRSSDYDGDGDADLVAVTGWNPSSVSVFLNGIFQED